MYISKYGDLILSFILRSKLTPRCDGMVYCAKCGTQNDDDAPHCTKCGETLKATQRDNRTWEDEIEEKAEAFGAKAEQFGRRMSARNMDDECFGSRDRSTGPLVFGVIIILVGLSSLLKDTYSWARFDNLWPVIIIGIGLLIVYNTTQRR